MITGRSFGPVRVIRNKLADEIIRLEAQGIDSQVIQEFIGEGRSRLASIEGDMENGSIQAGQAAGLIDEELSAKEIIDRMMSEAREIIARLGALPE